MSSFVLKILAIFFMVIDHVGYVLFPNIIALRIIGRLSFPLFAYQMAVGFSHTRNEKKHIVKLLLFAIICQFPYSYMIGDNSVLNILFTFVIALLIILLINHTKQDPKSSTSTISKILKCFVSELLIVGLVFLSHFLSTDYSWYGVLLTVGFYFTLNNKLASIIVFCTLVTLDCIVSQCDLMSILAFVSLMDIFFILAFNGKKGYNKSWIFYLLYFLHFIPILLLEHFA